VHARPETRIAAAQPRPHPGTGLLVLRNENQVMRRLLDGRRVRCDHAGRIWLAALSQLVGRRRRPGVFPVTPAAILRWHRNLVAASGTAPAGAGQDDHRPVRRSRP
jgi:hypothetical protein